MKADLNVKYIGKDVLMLHREIGKGVMPDGRECRFIMTNEGVCMEVYDKEKKGWKTYSLNWIDLSKAIADIILEIEKEKT